MGFEPDVVLGHSVGRYSAACVAGVFGLDDGAMLTAERGRLFGSLPAGGRMVAVFAAAERVESVVDEFRLCRWPPITVPTPCCRDLQDLDRAVAGLTADGCGEWLDTSHAFHRRCWIRSWANSSHMPTSSMSAHRKRFWCVTVPAPRWAEA